MSSGSRVPLAWLNLTHHKRRFAVALAGITFAVLLMFMQLGFWHALLDSMVAVVDRFDASLVLVHRLKYSLVVAETFPRARLTQAEAVAGVRLVSPLYLEYTRSLLQVPDRRMLWDPASRPIRVLAVDPMAPALAIPAIGQHAEELRLGGAVLMDRKSKPEFGEWEAGVRRELADRAVRVVGEFRLGTDFTTEGNIIMSEDEFARLFPIAGSRDLRRDAVSVGLVQLEAGADTGQVQQALERALPRDVEVLTRERFRDRERAFWARHTPVGFIFFIGLVMGFIVGVVICYQILSADVTDHLSEYATLKAIGYPNRYLKAVVLQEGLWLSLLGFVPGLVLARCAYWLLEFWTGLPLRLTVPRTVLVLALSVCMCVASGLIALRKVELADPAEVFG